MFDLRHLLIAFFVFGLSYIFSYTRRVRHSNSSSRRLGLVIGVVGLSIGIVASYVICLASFFGFALFIFGPTLQTNSWQDHEKFIFYCVTLMALIGVGLKIGALSASIFNRKS